jgi:succinyl-CoA synthetase alpha subunit
VVAFIAGRAAPPGKKMGHAGAIVTGNSGSYAGKRTALERSGVLVTDTPRDIPAAVSRRLAERNGGHAPAVMPRKTA